MSESTVSATVSNNLITKVYRLPKFILLKFIDHEIHEMTLTASTNKITNIDLLGKIHTLKFSDLNNHASHL